MTAPKTDGGVVWDPAGPGYPCQITVFCDRCGVEHTGDYLVTDECTKTARLGYARAHMRRLGWQCDDTGDYCPEHAKPAPAEHEFTPDLIERGIAIALENHDLEVIPSLISLLAAQAPDRAQTIIDAIELAARTRP